MMCYTGMGISPLTWSEIDSWLSRTQLEIPIWEILSIREMSMAYVGEYNQASDEDRPPPYASQAIKQLQKQKVNNDLKSFLKSSTRAK
jgi:hypothetical protein